MSFITSNLPEQYKNHLLQSGGWNENCPIKLDRLSLVQVFFQDFTGQIQEGELICFDVAAQNILNIFKSLFESGFPINSIIPLSKFDYNDEKSMNANNSSCFNNRLISSGNKLSIHSYGLALDINPEQNPMISINEEENDFTNSKIYPALGKNYVNRLLLKQGMIEPVVEIFLKNGFDIWGGLWQSLIDYHHFEVNRTLAEKLAKSSKEESHNLWHNHLQNCNRRL